MASKRSGPNAGDNVVVRAYPSPTVTLLAFDWPAGSKHADFLGFAIRRSPGYHPGDKDAYLLNKLSFAAPEPGSQPIPSDLAPFQKFMWWDSGITTEQRGKRLTYTLIPVRGTGPSDLQLLFDQAGTCEVTVPTIKDENGIYTYFNRAVVSSQSFSREFPDPTKDKQTLETAMEWLANGLQDAIPSFTKRANGLAGAVYHLTDALWTLPALKSVQGDRSLAYFRKVHEHRPGTKGSGATDDTVDDAAVAQLKRAGYETAARTKAAIMHDKFLVRYSAGKPAAVLMGSANFTPEGLTVQANLLHQFDSPALAQLYADRQRALKADPSMKSLAANAAWSRVIKVGKASVRVFFPPEPGDSRESIDVIVDAVKHAKQSVIFCMFSPTDKQLLEALFKVGDQKKLMFGLLNSISDPSKSNDKKNQKLIADGEAPKELSASAKVQVELFNRSRRDRDVLAYSYFTPGTAPANFLPELSSIDTSAFSTLPPVAPKNGKNKHSQPPAVHVHHKFIVIDAETDTPTIYTGSANMSNNSMHNNDENVLEVKNAPALARLYLAEFMRLYEHFRARAIWDQTHTKSGKPKPKKSQKRTRSTSAHEALVLKRSRDEWIKGAYTRGTREYNARVFLAYDK